MGAVGIAGGWRGVVACLCACAAGQAAEPRVRAIGGRDVREGEFPFVVRLEHELRYERAGLERREYFPVCTGTALAPRWTLTARHCLAQPEDDAVSALHGELWPRPLAARAHDDGNVSVREIIRYGPPLYEPKRALTADVQRVFLYHSAQRAASFDDVALVRTAPVVVAQYARLGAAPHAALLYRAVWAMGFGRTNTSSGPALASTLSVSKPLQVVRGMLLPCSERYPFPLLCVSTRCGRATSLCGGDSGGPVLLGGRVVALNSLAPVLDNCQMLSDVPRRSVFVVVLPVDLYLDWIHSTLDHYASHFNTTRR